MAAVLTLDSSFSGAVVLFAMPREARPFLRSFARRSYHVEPGHCLCSDAPHAAGGDVLVELLGIGVEDARACVERLLRTGMRPRVIIVAGYAGALRSGLAVGDVVSAADVIDAAGRVWRTAWPPSARSGRVYTSDRFIESAKEKCRIGQELEADVVEMESAAVAEVCERHGVPFGCVRAISDAADKSLPKAVFGLMEGGRVRVGRVLREVVRSPRMLGELIRLGKHTRLASRNLAEALREWLNSTTPDGATKP